MARVADLLRNHWLRYDLSENVIRRVALITDEGLTNHDHHINKVIQIVKNMVS